MKKNLSIIFNSIIAIIFIFILNVFEKNNSNTTHLISINIILLLNLIISLFCFITIKIVFKSYDFNNNKKFKENFKNAIANSFFFSSIISIIIALIIYCFLKNILELFNIEKGIINYTTFASKIWFVSSPFIGLELTIFKYFSKLEVYKKITIILLIKFIAYFILSLILSIKFQNNCIVYAKPICDIIFLPYYTKICFDLTLKS
jgi:hypothetical protein